MPPSFVPDLYLTGIGLYDVRKSLVACLYALLGAIVGGAIMYYWGTRDIGGALDALNSIPSISTGMLAGAHALIVEMGTWTVLRGPLLGVPYKIFAFQAASGGIGLTSFLLMSIPARLIRFLVIITVIPFLVNRLAGRRPFVRKLIILIAGWAAFYFYYFLSSAISSGSPRVPSGKHFAGLELGLQISFGRITAGFQYYKLASVDTDTEIDGLVGSQVAAGLSIAAKFFQGTLE